MATERENPDTPPSRRSDAFNVPGSFPLIRASAIQNELEGKRQQLLDVLAKKYNPYLEKELLRVEKDLFDNR